MVLEYLRKGLELGVHAVSDKKKAKFAIDELVKAGKITIDEGKIFMEEVHKAAIASEKHMKSALKGHINTHLNRAGYVSKSEVEQLKKKIRNLEKKLKKK